MKPRQCAIPLLSARRPGSSDKMPVMRPADKAWETSREPKLKVPAPPCDEKFFRNR
jgi:hypothetical protein